MRNGKSNYQEKTLFLSIQKFLESWDSPIYNDLVEPIFTEVGVLHPATLQKELTRLDILGIFRSTTFKDYFPMKFFS